MCVFSIPYLCNDTQCTFAHILCSYHVIENISLHRKPTTLNHTHLSLDRNGSTNKNVRLNKFVRRLHDMLVAGKVVEWRRGLLVLHNIDEFANNVLPKYFNTRNYKTFRRQLNYYGKSSLCS